MSLNVQHITRRDVERSSTVVVPWARMQRDGVPGDKLESKIMRALLWDEYAFIVPASVFYHNEKTPDSLFTRDNKTRGRLVNWLQRCLRSMNKRSAAQHRALKAERVIGLALKQAVHDIVDGQQLLPPKEGWDPARVIEVRRQLEAALLATPEGYRILTNKERALLVTLANAMESGSEQKHILFNMLTRL